MLHRSLKSPQNPLVNKNELMKMSATKWGFGVKYSLTGFAPFFLVKLLCVCDECTCQFTSMIHNYLRVYTGVGVRGYPTASWKGC